LPEVAESGEKTKDQDLQPPKDRGFGTTPPTHPVGAQSSRNGDYTWQRPGEESGLHGLWESKSRRNPKGQRCPHPNDINRPSRTCVLGSREEGGRKNRRWSLAKNQIKVDSKHAASQGGGCYEPGILRLFHLSKGGSGERRTEPRSWAIG